MPADDRQIPINDRGDGPAGRSPEGRRGPHRPDPAEYERFRGQRRLLRLHETNEVLAYYPAASSPATKTSSGVSRAKTWPIVRCLDFGRQNRAMLGWIAATTTLSRCPP